MKSFIYLFVFVCIVQITFSQFLPKLNGLESSEEIHWAVLVAGSNSFWNYRHQSDVFHAYQTLIKRGLSADNIIVLAYDDVANHRENPFRGKVFNKPDPNGEGEDVYENVKIDYSGKDVFAKNFLNIITGNKAKVKGGNGRVLESKATDNVFIYFADHGAVGLVAFPSTELYADQLNNALEKMHTKNMYNKLVFYMEACESGSMFKNILKNNTNVYATTAANSNESSWAYYCDPDDKVNGVSIGSCLGDEYSIHWIENADSTQVNNEETLYQQYNIIKQQTTKSHVQRFGDFSYANETISDFEGYDAEKKKTYIEKIIEFLTKEICLLRDMINYPCAKDSKKANKAYLEYLKKAKDSSIDSRKAKINYLMKKSETTNDPQYEEMLKEELNHMENTNKIYKDFDLIFNIDRNEDAENLKIDFNCLRNSVEAYKKCNDLREYDLIFVRNIAFACNKHKPEGVVQFFNNLC